MYGFILKRENCALKNTIINIKNDIASYFLYVLVFICITRLYVHICFILLGNDLLFSKESNYKKYQCSLFEIFHVFLNGIYNKKIDAPQTSNCVWYISMLRQTHIPKMKKNCKMD